MQTMAAMYFCYHCHEDEDEDETGLVVSSGSYAKPFLFFWFLAAFPEIFEVHESLICNPCRLCIA
jgi:hypothetical protein